MDTLLQDIKYGIRMLAKHRGATIVAVLTLALGIGANTTVFTMLKGIALRPLPGVRAADALVVLLTRSQGGNQGPLNYLDYIDIRDRNDVLSGVAGTFPVPLILGRGDQAERVWGEIVTGNLFQVLGVRPALGRLLTPDDDRPGNGDPSAVISYALWQRKFAGDPGVIGRPLQVGTRTLTIVGVTAPDYRGSMVGLSLHVFVPIRLQPDVMAVGNLIDRPDRDNHWVLTIGRLKPGVSFAQARAALRLISERLNLEFPNPSLEDRALLVPLSQSPYGSQAVLLPVVEVLMIVVGVVLLVACANLSNIMLARATVRRQEIALRLAIGAGRARVMRQLLTESLLLSLVGGAVALLVSLWAIDLLSQFEIPLQYPVVVNARFDGLVFGFALLASALSGIIFGLAPAWQSSRMSLASALVDARSSAPLRTSRLRSGLLVAQVSLSLALLISATLMVQSQARVGQVNPGFDSGNVHLLSLDLGQSGYDASTGSILYRDVLAKVSALPGVESASVAWQLPLMVVGMMTRGVEVDGYVPRQSEDMNFGFNVVSPDYFASMRIPVLRGRAFDARDEAASGKVAIVTDAFARRFWPDTDPIGRTIRMGGQPMQVVGVVRAIKYLTLTEDPKPYVYTPIAQSYVPQAILHVRARGETAAVQAAITRAVHTVDRALPVFDVRTMRDYTAVSLGTFDLASLFLTVSGLQALVLAAIGIYGVIAFGVAQRTREIGIRIALGARPEQVLRLVMRQGFVLSLVGVALGVVMALASTRFLASLLFGVDARDPVTFVGVATGLLAVATVACWVPARRAMRVDPITALRCE